MLLAEMVNLLDSVLVKLQLPAVLTFKKNQNDDKRNKNQRDKTTENGPTIITKVHFIMEKIG